MVGGISSKKRPKPIYIMAKYDKVEDNMVNVEEKKVVKEGFRYVHSLTDMP